MDYLLILFCIVIALDVLSTLALWASRAYLRYWQRREANIVHLHLPADKYAELMHALSDPDNGGAEFTLSVTFKHSDVAY